MILSFNEYNSALKFINYYHVLQRVCNVKINIQNTKILLCNTIMWNIQE